MIGIYKNFSIARNNINSSEIFNTLVLTCLFYNNFQPVTFVKADTFFNNFVSTQMKYNKIFVYLLNGLSVKHLKT